MNQIKTPKRNLIKTFFSKEFSGWSAFDLTWLLCATAVILGLSIYWKDSIIGIISALSGIWCVILTGKGKRFSFIVGTVNVIFYSIISFNARYYGEVMLNLLYYLPMNFVGWIMWSKHLDSNTGEVKKAHLSCKGSLLTYSLTAIAIFIYGIVLKYLGGALPYIDSMSTVISVTAQILSVRRLKEQWILWIAVDAVTIVLWGINFAQGKDNIATLAMWIIYFINAIIMYVKWNKEAK